MGRGRRVAPASRGGRASAGAIYLLLPLLIFAYAAIWLARNTPGSTWEGGREIELEELDAPESMRGLRGELELPGGARLLAQLTPLHAAEAWQAFDARALAERLELGPGEPWRLELWLEDASGGESVAVADARVEDGQGAALSRVKPAVSVDDGDDGDGTLRDPLGTLLAGSAQPLTADRTADRKLLLVLWGRRPGEEVELVLEGGARTVPLGPVEVQRRGVPRYLASIDRTRASDAEEEE